MKKREKTNWQNRIVESGEMPADQFLAHDLNARRHPAKQREALRGSLNEVGWIAPVIVSARTGKLLDGHARIEEALSKNDQQFVPFVKVDVSEAEESLILASFDPIAALAEYDREALDNLLQDISTGEAGLQALMADLVSAHGLHKERYDLYPDSGSLKSDSSETISLSENRPLAVVLNIAQSREWDKFKAEHSFHTDTQAFLWLWQNNQ